MSADIRFLLNSQPKLCLFYINSGPDNTGDHILAGIKPEHVLSITLNGDELEHAINNLGAVKVNKPVVTYFGDEAKRIFFNW